MNRVLIANRGEIAIRISRTLRELGIESVGIYHEDEKGDGHVNFVDKAVCLGNGSLTDTYLNIPKIIAIALDYKCDAIHPGYGFLSENYNFAYACEANNICFIGPHADAIQSMAIKSKAKEVAKKANVPVLEGVTVTSITEARERLLDYPVLIKAVAGGGGKGLKIVRNPEEFEAAYLSAKREALQYFGNGDLMLEPYIEDARHIEVQILGDNSGEVIHLYERECSIQRNYQKVIEEAPAYGLPGDIRKQLHKAAIRYAKQLNYTNAGTIEFLVKGNKFWFLEMNTRIQVEHPVTEMITGVDIVKEQIRLAEGYDLSNSVLNARPKGHAIEVRICSELPFQNFRPSTGQVSYVKFPQNTRVDTYLETNTKVLSHFDSMLAKLIVHADNRERAIEKLNSSLKNSVVIGVDTNINYLEEIIGTKEYSTNTIDTNFLNREYTRLEDSYSKRRNAFNGDELIPAFLYSEYINPVKNKGSLWNHIGRAYKNSSVEISVNDNVSKVTINSDSKSGKRFSYKHNEEEFNVKIVKCTSNSISYTINNKLFESSFSRNISEDIYYYQGFIFKVKSSGVLRMAEKVNNFKNNSSVSNLNQIRSPLFGKVINVNVNKSDKVKKGQVLITIESMKTENHIVAPDEGIVDRINVEEGLQVKENVELLTLSPIN